MANYYEILGLRTDASLSEIKAAFRRLAKQYHPDRNSDGIEHFNEVLKAYETLVDPRRKAAYDYRLQNNLPQHDLAARKPGSKSWSFSEKELKRRQYYNEHIRKYAKATASYNAEAESKRSYNEFKYILFALPLAVGLFILIMRLATPDRKLAPRVIGESQARLRAAPVETPQQGDSPYSAHFGDAVYVAGSDRRLTIRNHTGAEVVVCVFADSAFIRSFFMKDGYSAEVMQLPRKELTIRYALGTEFDYLLKPAGTDVHGAFSRGMGYYGSSKPFFAGTANELTLTPGESGGFIEIGTADFFKKKANR